MRDGELVDSTTINWKPYVSFGAIRFQMLAADQGFSDDGSRYGMSSCWKAIKKSHCG